MNGEDDRPFSPAEAALLGRLRDVINETATRVSKTLVAEDTEEPDISARLAEAIETELRHQPLQVGRMRVSATAHTTKSHSAGSTETESGVDLYVALTRIDDLGITNKGFIIQSKRADKLRKGHKRLRNQANRMRTRSQDESYVAIFDKHGVEIVSAERATYPKLPKDFRRDPEPLGDVVSDGLRCRRGDKELGRGVLELPETVETRAQSVSDIMRRLRARNGLGFRMSRAVTSRMRLKGD